MGASGDSGGSAQRRRVLIVDDEPSICLSFRLALGRHFDFEPSPHPEHAIQRLQSEEFDVAVVDLCYVIRETDRSMRIEHGGEELCRRIKREWPFMGVVVMSGIIAPGEVIGVTNAACADACFVKGSAITMENPGRKMLELADAARRNRSAFAGRLRLGLTPHSNDTAREEIVRSLQESSGNVSVAAEALNIGRSTFYKLVGELGIEVEAYRRPTG